MCTVLFGSLFLIILLVGAGDQQRACDIDTATPGSLGGVRGTGLTADQVAQVRRASPYRGPRLSDGGYEATAYGPPWGGIQGAGVSTSGGLAIRGGNPRWYMIAVDPALIQHGNLVYLWPNPFEWTGPFLAADTGGAIKGRHIDFYDWRGVESQNRWGTQEVRASATPIVPNQVMEAGVLPVSGGCGLLTLSTDVGERIAQIARSKIDSGPSIPDFQPATISVAWCAWFATNVWRKAGVPIPYSAYSGAVYDWAAANDLLFKPADGPPKGATPPVGAALLYGSGSKYPGSLHVNLVDEVKPDGSFMVTGGNQGNLVTRYGPCHLRVANPAYITGNGCDGRPIYGIAVPARAS